MAHHTEELATRVGPAASEPVQLVAFPRAEGGDAFHDRYRAEAVLGRGGMGEVRLCRDKRIGRDVAFKVMRAESGDRGRFVREALVQGQLEHPSVVPVYDIGVDPAGALFFTMKRVRGQSLREVLAAAGSPDSVVPAPVGERRLVSALSSVCLAVDFAHHRGVVHRDLKPDNIMLGAYGEVYVLDWGVAKVLGAEDPVPRSTDEPPPSQRVDAGSTPPTLAGSVLGTPGYMAPEQLAGLAATPAADVYALGAMLYEVLTLERLHGKGPMEERIGSTLLGDADAARARLDELGVAPELAAACLRATAREPDGRFASARELADVLERFLDGDRDQALRRAMSRDHAALGEKLADEDKGPEAVRELGRALALDPQNARALAALGRVLATPPKNVPPEVEAEVRQAEVNDEREGARFGAHAMPLWFVTMALVLAMGLRSPVTIAVQLAAAVAALAVILANRKSITPWRRRLLLACLLVCASALSRLFGPLLVGPGIAATVGAPFAFHDDRRERLGVHVPMVLAAVLGPFALELAGVLPPSYRFEAGRLVVLPNLADFPPALTLGALVLFAIITTLVPMLMLGAVGEALRAARRRLLLHRWQLKHLAPAEGSAKE